MTDVETTVSTVRNGHYFFLQFSRVRRLSDEAMGQVAEARRIYVVESFLGMSGRRPEAIYKLAETLERFARRHAWRATALRSG